MTEIERQYTDSLLNLETEQETELEYQIRIKLKSLFINNNKNL